MMYIQLPDRKEITLFEAVTAFVYGECRDASSGAFYDSHASSALLRELDCAAKAGRVRFRAVKSGINKYQEIDPSYFRTQRFHFVWNSSEIHCLVPIDEIDDYVPRKYEGEYDAVWSLDWFDVYLDREQFVLLLREIGVSVKQGPDTDVPGKRKTLTTGVAGRPTSRHLVEKMARRRLDTGDYPETLAAFSEELAKELRDAEPEAARMTAKTIKNAIGPLWRARQKRPK